MITNISLLTLWVKDIDESLAFYTDVMGFEVHEDLRLGPDFRWCTVRHPRQPELAVHLSTPGGPLPDDLVAAMTRAQDEGGLPGIGLEVDDCRATFEELRGRGVEFLQEPVTRSYAGLRTFLAHGDGLGKGDLGYRFMKLVLRGRLTAAVE